VHYLAGHIESRTVRKGDGSEVWPWAVDPVGSKTDPKPWPAAVPLQPQVKGVIALGYPLFHAKYNRIKPLGLLPVRCAFFCRNLHSRMPLVATPARLKRLHVINGILLGLSLSYRLTL
jgi:hypothetical protein